MGLDNNSQALKEAEEKRKMVMHHRLLWLFIILDIILFGYIIYSLISIFTSR